MLDRSTIPGAAHRSESGHGAILPGGWDGNPRRALGDRSVAQPGVGQAAPVRVSVAPGAMPRGSRSPRGTSRALRYEPVGR